MPLRIAPLASERHAFASARLVNVLRIFFCSRGLHAHASYDEHLQPAPSLPGHERA
jgi:hypothetical protein